MTRRNIILLALIMLTFTGQSFAGLIGKGTISLKERTTRREREDMAYNLACVDIFIQRNGREFLVSRNKKTLRINNQIESAVYSENIIFQTLLGSIIPRHLVSTIQRYQEDNNEGSIEIGIESWVLDSLIESDNKVKRNKYSNLLSAYNRAIKENNDFGAYIAVLNAYAVLKQISIMNNGSDLIALNDLMRLAKDNIPKFTVNIKSRQSKSLTVNIVSTLNGLRIRNIPFTFFIGSYDLAQGCTDKKGEASFEIKLPPTSSYTDSVSYYVCPFIGDKISIMILRTDLGIAMSGIIPMPCPTSKLVNHSGGKLKVVSQDGSVILVEAESSINLLYGPYNISIHPEGRDSIYRDYMLLGNRNIKQPQTIVGRYRLPRKQYVKFRKVFSAILGLSLFSTGVWQGIEASQDYQYSENALSFDLHQSYLKDWKTHKTLTISFSVSGAVILATSFIH